MDNKRLESAQDYIQYLSAKTLMGEPVNIDHEYLADIKYCLNEMSILLQATEEEKSPCE